MNIVDPIIIFVIAFIGTPLIRKIALASGITDDACGDPLKIHKQPVALLGELAIVVAVAIGIIGSLRGGFALGNMP